MRKMIARTGPLKTYPDPSAAIRGSKEMHLRTRTVSDDQVRGKTIVQVVWNDAAIGLVLDDGRILHVVAQAGGITCSLESDLKVDRESASDNEVLLELDGHAIRWNRAELAHKFIGKSLERLWFGEYVVYVYTKNALLACHFIESSPEGKAWVFWTESD